MHGWSAATDILRPWLILSGQTGCPLVVGTDEKKGNSRLLRLRSTQLVVVYVPQTRGLLMLVPCAVRAHPALTFDREQSFKTQASSIRSGRPPTLSSRSVAPSLSVCLPFCQPSASLSTGASSPSSRLTVGNNPPLPSLRVPCLISSLPLSSSFRPRPSTTFLYPRYFLLAYVLFVHRYKEPLRSRVHIGRSQLAQ